MEIFHDEERAFFMKTKHYFVFDKTIQEKFDNNLLNAENWEKLRMDEKRGEFSIEKDIKSYEQNCRNSHMYQEAAKIICKLISSKNGAGGGGRLYHWG